jgi:hypothetical protein
MALAVVILTLDVWRQRQRSTNNKSISSSVTTIREEQKDEHDYEHDSAPQAK